MENIKLYTVRWFMFKKCNFNCSYCLQGKKTNELGYDLNKLISYAEKINALIDEESNLYLIGGEITIIPIKDFLSILDKFTSNLIHKVIIRTNLSGSDKWYDTFVKYIYDRGWLLKFTASFHEEFFDLDRFILKAKKYNAEVEMVETLSNTELVNQFRIKCKENNLNYVIDKDVNSFGDNLNRHYGKPTNGLLCSDSTYQFVVDEEGRIYGGCFKRLIGILGMTKKINKKWSICQSDICRSAWKHIIKDIDGNVVYDSINNKVKNN